jgi:hypothetical protein
MPNIIMQGVDCWISASNIINVRTGVQMNVTGYTVTAVACALYRRQVLGQYRWQQQWRMNNPIVAQWSTTPTGTQGLATAGTNAVITTQPIDQVTLHVTPAQTANWRYPLVIVQAKLIDPVTGFDARIINETYEVSPDAVVSL